MVASYRPPTFGTIHDCVMVYCLDYCVLCPERLKLIQRDNF